MNSCQWRQKNIRCPQIGKLNYQIRKQKQRRPQEKQKVINKWINDLQQNNYKPRLSSVNVKTYRFTFRKRSSWYVSESSVNIIAIINVLTILYKNQIIKFMNPPFYDLVFRGFVIFTHIFFKLKRYSHLFKINRHIISKQKNLKIKLKMFVFHSVKNW